MGDYTCPHCGEEAQAIVDVKGTHEINPNGVEFHTDKFGTDTTYYMHCQSEYESGCVELR